MTKISKQKTFYAKEFEEVLRQYFHCPSKTLKKKPFPYIFIQNKDNPTHVYRTKENGMADIYMKSLIDSSIIEERYLTFFPYQNKATGGFTIGKNHWDNFIGAENKSGEKNHWGVFCIDKDSFILASNQSKFITHDIDIVIEQYTFKAVEVHIQNGIYFSFNIRKEFGEEWTVINNGNSITTNPDHNYKPLLKHKEKAFCMPLPRAASKHLFCIKDPAGFKGIITDTIPNIANRYHGTSSVKIFMNKLRRNLESNKKQVEKGLRMKSIDDCIIVIPDDFEKEDFIDWQQSHLKNKTDDKNYHKDKMRQLRQSK